MLYDRLYNGDVLEQLYYGVVIDWLYDEDVFYLFPNRIIIIDRLFNVDYIMEMFLNWLYHEDVLNRL